MENPEEVLQLLDEFQKTRPAEIPCELEDYLCWVAKTGDPVYQWSVVKPLFREKLTRVMSDFYESCPSLEFAPCPNVEQFNYDVMKCNLLDLLDAFANAPFTVQRICELLTAPRKQYNRVDKFMRAIEKNILVVSTREPGPTARRNENGDGMVNGSMDEDTPSSQSSHDVEMESWVKDCTTEASVNLPNAESDMPLLESVIAGAKPTKNCTAEDVQPKTEEPTLRSETPTVRSEIKGLESETKTIVADAADVPNVPEAAINDDTSSPPSLETEDVNIETSHVTKNEVDKSNIADVPLIQPDSTTSAQKIEDLSEKANSSTDSHERDVPHPENCAEKRPRSDSESTDPDTGENIQNDTPEAEMMSPFKKLCTEVSESRSEESASLSSSVVAEAVESVKITEVATMEEEEEDTEQETATIAKPESSCAKRLASSENSEPIIEEVDESKDDFVDSTDNSLAESDRPESSAASDTAKPIVEEPIGDNDEYSSKSPRSTSDEQSDSGVTIEESMDDDATSKSNKSLIPDPIPIVEEPKDTETTENGNVSITTIEELPEITEKKIVETAEVLVTNDIVEATNVEEKTVVEEVTSMAEDVTNVQPIIQEDITDVQSSSAESKVEPAESMEIDSEEPIAAFQQDEPMEQEPGDKS